MDIPAECSSSITTSSLTVPQLDISRSTDGVQGVDILALVMNSPGALSQPKTSNEELIAQRVSKRAAQKAGIHAKAESYKRKGDLFYESKNYKAAYPQYLEAIQVLGNVPEYYISLAAAYRKLTWNEEAAHAATRALTIDPKNLEARYVRGVARLEQKLLQAAQTDFESVLEHDPTHLRALAAIAEVRQFMSQAELEDIREEDTIVDFGFPHWDYEALEVGSMSDSSDCQHVGNGVPCRFYNHDGCGRGTECLYSHAPDEKSVRDDLGKNICIYHILDSCKFGAARCVYSHSRDALPKRGWWNSPEKVAKVKEVLEVAEQNAKEQRQVEIARWRTEMRFEVRTRHAMNEAREKPQVEPALRIAELEEKKLGTKARTVPIDGSKKKQVTKKGVKKPTEESSVVDEVKPEGDNSEKTEAPVNATAPTSEKANTRNEAKKKVIGPQVGQQKKVVGANGAASTAPTIKKRTNRFYHHRRRKVEAAPGDHSTATTT